MNTKKMVAMSAITMMGTISLSGMVHADEVGQGQAQVTYNVNQINPDDPTANPDFTVLIPSVYQLTDASAKTPAAGEVSIKDAQDLSKDYTGDQTVNVSVTSTKNFTFDNGGVYKLVTEDNSTSIPATNPIK